MKNVILSACTFLFVLLFSSASYAGNPLKNLKGNWINENSNTQFLAKMKLLPHNGRYIAWVWADCHPKDCYWGKKYNTPYPASMQVRFTYVHGAKTTNILIKPLPKNRIRVVIKVTYKGKLKHKSFTKVEYFKRYNYMPRPNFPGGGRNRL